MKLAFASMAALLAATAAYAHVTLETPASPPNGMSKFVLRIPHGCDGRSTKTVRVRLPAGVIAAKPMPKPGWILDTVTGPYDRTYDYYGTPMSEGVSEIVWSGGDLPDTFYDEFVFRARVTGFPAGHVLAFPTIQECDGGQAAWTEVPKPGQDPHALAHPAPTLTILAAAEGGHGGPGAGSMSHGDLSVEKAWARASAGPARNGAGYLTISNAGAEDDRLIGAAAPGVAERIELHTHIKDGNIMRMRPVEAIDVPAGGTATLEPGGRHLMMMGLKAPLEAGQSVPVTLTFERAGEVTVTLEVMIGGPADGGHGGSSN